MRGLLPSRADLATMRRDPKRDFIAGVTVAVVALPLALAFGIASGMGATAGLVTAIVAGFLAAAFGGSNLQVSGPTGAMTVVLLPIVATFGASGVLAVGLIAGVILVALALIGAGRSLQFIPLPVIEGFTLGIAVIIGLQQVPAALGEHASGDRVLFIAIQAIADWVHAPQWTPVCIALAVAAVILVAARIRPGFPVSLLAVIVVTVFSVVAHLDAATIGAIPAGLPAPKIPSVPWASMNALVMPAIAVAALAALESLLCATVADAMRVGERHDSNRELFGQGIANIVTPMFGGVPATAAIARTAVNVRTGARSRLASMLHSVVLLFVMVFAARWVGLVPLAALAGVLLATVVQMVEVSNIRALLRSTRADAVIVIVTAVATVALDLVVAVLIGIVIAAFAALANLARSARVEHIPADQGDFTAEEAALLREHVVVYRLDGPLFFGAAHRFLVEISEVSDVRVVILRLSRIRSVDATGAAVLRSTIADLQARGVLVLLSGVRDEHRTVFTAQRVFAVLNDDSLVFARTPEAIDHAREYLRLHQ